MGEGKSVQLFGTASAETGNNFARPDGQNVGNFLGARPSSRVLAAPGGASTVSFGNQPPAGTVEPPRAAPEKIETEEQPPAQPTAADKKASFLSAMTAKIAGHAGAVPSTPPRKASTATTATTPPSQVSSLAAGSQINRCIYAHMCFISC